MIEFEKCCEPVARCTFSGQCCPVPLLLIEDGNVPCALESAASSHRKHPESLKSDWGGGRIKILVVLKFKE